MTRTRRRILSLCLTLALVAGAMAAAVQAASGEPEQTTEPERGTMTYTEPIAPQYEAAKLFSEGLAAVRQGGKWGYIASRRRRAGGQSRCRSSSRCRPASPPTGPAGACPSR